MKSLLVGRKFMSDFIIRDSGKRQEFEGGMIRDTQENKIDYARVLDGPMFSRWAQHLTKGCEKYPDVEPGVPNWTLAKGQAEYVRFKKSAIRHFIQAMQGQKDEDHFAAVFFNLNGMAYIEDKLNEAKLRQQARTTEAEKVNPKSQQASSATSVDLRETWAFGRVIRTDDKGKY